MMNMHTEIVAAALAVVLSIPLPWYPPDAPLPETQAEREVRLEVVVEHVVTEGESIMIEENYFEEVGLELVDLVALGLMQIKNESYFAHEVHSGLPWPGRPAPRGDNGKAICFFQMQKTASMVPFKRWRPLEAKDWELLEGLSVEATQRCAYAGMRTLAYHGWRCRRPLKKLYRNGVPKSRADRLWVAAHLIRENGNPKPYGKHCRHISKGSLKRAKTYMKYRDRIEQELAAIAFR